MSRQPISAFVFALMASLPLRAAAELKIVATTAQLASVAKAVGGTRVDVEALALPTQDAHFVDARPHLALRLARADLLIVVGLDLELGWLPVLQTGARNGDVQRGASGYLDCSEVVDKLDVPAVRVDRSMGDVHPGGSPHYMSDPRRVAQVAHAIAQRMERLDRAGAEHYRRGERQFLAQLARARTRWERELAPLRGARVIAYHRSQSYLADWLQLDVVEHVEPRPGIPPNPRHVAHVLQLVRSLGVTLLVQESYYPTNTSEAIARRSGARLVRLPGGPDLAAGQSYFDYMDELVARLGRQEGHGHEGHGG
jgi:zinc/manganese transport system substrate-binding protein